jgi:phosphoglycolate phosphatase-like HAD superfamily hydrolase
MKLPRRPAAVVFDMDGLLLDTEILYQEAILLAAAERGHEVAPGFSNQTVGLPWEQCRKTGFVSTVSPIALMVENPILISLAQ